MEKKIKNWTHFVFFIKNRLILIENDAKIWIGQNLVDKIVGIQIRIVDDSIQDP